MDNTRVTAIIRPQTFEPVPTTTTEETAEQGLMRLIRAIDPFQWETTKEAN
jgi:hypothetical protein